MFKVRVDVKGFDKYTGLLGTVPFTDGVSDREITEIECARLGAVMKIVKLDSDEQVGASSNMVRNRNMAAEVRPAMQPKAEEPKVAEVEKPLKYTKEDLEALAEKEGMKGIRKIADEFEVKGVQISKMIDGIIAAQTTKED